MAGLTNINFSAFNVEYFTAIRDAACANAMEAAEIFGASDSFVSNIASLSARQLSSIVYINIPLVTPRDNAQWWPPFMRALSIGNKREVIELADQIGFYILGQHKST